MNEKGISVFISYSHKDERYRESLEAHMSILSRQGKVSTWHDRRINPGQEWENQIDEHIKKSDLILLLISSDFIASEYCFSKELSIAIENHEAQKSVVIPVIVRPSEWSDAPFSKLQGVPKDARAVTTWENEDEAWLDVVKGIKKAIETIQANKVRTNENSGLLSMRTVLNQEVKRLESVFDSLDCGGISTGLADLDHFIDGLHESQLIVLASRPTMGKTSLALKVASHIAINESLPVAFFSLKVPSNQLTRNLISSVGFINSHDLLRGNLTDEDWPKIVGAVERLKESPLFIDESPSISISQIRKKAFELKEKHGIKLIIIDSIQHLAFNSSTVGDNSEKSYYSKALKQLAKDLKTPVFVTVTLPRHIDDKINKRPMLGDLSEWDGLSEDSDAVVFLYRDQIYNPDSDLTELLIAKNANGPTGLLNIIYDPESSSFINMGRFEQ